MRESWPGRLSPWLSAAAAAFLIVILTSAGWAQGEDVAWPPLSIPGVSIDPVEGSNVSPNMQVMFFTTALALIPQFVVSCTAYIRVSITLSYMKSALGSTQALSNQLMMGICLIMTAFIMYPVFERTNNYAVQPYLQGEITQKEFSSRFGRPLKEWMLYQTRCQDPNESEMAVFYTLRYMGGPRPSVPQTIDDIPFSVLYPAFIMSEVKTGFFIGFLIYLPFLVVDMVVAATLMSMGMFMIPPSSISLPFKLLLFVTIDGWNLLLEGLIKSFNSPSWMAK